MGFYSTEFVYQEKVYPNSFDIYTFNPLKRIDLKQIG